MRSFATTVGLAAVLLVNTGCDGTKWGFLRNSSNDTARFSGKTPTATELVAYLNRDASQVRTLECLDLEMTCRSGPSIQTFDLSGKMVCQRDRDFRLVGEALGSCVVDMGSNKDEFWYWIKQADPPYLYHCAYRDMEAGVRMPIPFQPEWVMEALGLAEYAPADQNATVTVKERNYLLTQQSLNPQKQPVRKLTVVSRVEGQTHVRAHLLYDASNKLICGAYIEDVQQINGIEIPKRVVLDWPDQKLKMTVRLKKVVLNRPIGAQQAESLFVRPNLNVQAYDLARGLEGQPGLQRAGAVMR